MLDAWQSRRGDRVAPLAAGESRPGSKGGLVQAHLPRHDTRESDSRLESAAAAEYKLVRAGTTALAGASNLLDLHARAAERVDWVGRRKPDLVITGDRSLPPQRAARPARASRSDENMTSSVLLSGLGVTDPPASLARRRKPRRSVQIDGDHYVHRRQPMGSSMFPNLQSLPLPMHPQLLPPGVLICQRSA